MKIECATFRLPFQSPRMSVKGRGKKSVGLKLTAVRLYSTFPKHAHNYFVLSPS